jgi:septum formation protein
MFSELNIEPGSATRFRAFYISMISMIYSTVKPLILASNSPRRKDFLNDLGLEFTQYAEEIDETPHINENPAAYVERMARQKALIVSSDHPESYVLAADTAVCLGDTILGKPSDAEDAVRMLLSLAGRDHIVRSGICLACRDEKTEITCSVATVVSFSPFNEAVARCYVAQGESLDKAGAYGIQGSGAFLVQKIEGSYTNVVGLPLAEVVTILMQEGVILTVNSY